MTERPKTEVRAGDWTEQDSQFFREDMGLLVKAGNWTEQDLDNITPEQFRRMINADQKLLDRVRELREQNSSSKNTQV